jgi:hypothetical protein
VSAGREVGSQPPVRPRQRGCQLWRERREQGADERQHEHRSDDEATHRVGRDGEQRDLVELEPRDRRGRKAARCRDGDTCSKGSRQRVALEPDLESRRDEENREHRGEGELEAGIKCVVRAPREQGDRCHDECVARISLAPREPGERTERACDSRANNGRLGTNRKHVTSDHRKHGNLGRRPRQADQQCKPEHPERDHGDVPAADGEQVVETAGAEVLTQPVG